MPICLSFAFRSPCWDRTGHPSQGCPVLSRLGTAGIRQDMSRLSRLPGLSTGYGSHTRPLLATAFPSCWSLSEARLKAFFFVSWGAPILTAHRSGSATSFPGQTGSPAEHRISRLLHTGRPLPEAPAGLPPDRQTGLAFCFAGPRPAGFDSSTTQVVTSSPWRFLAQHHGFQPEAEGVPVLHLPLLHHGGGRSAGLLIRHHLNFRSMAPRRPDHPRAPLA